MENNINHIFPSHRGLPFSLKIIIRSATFQSHTRVVFCVITRYASCREKCCRPGRTMVWRSDELAVRTEKLVQPSDAAARYTHGAPQTLIQFACKCQVCYCCNFQTLRCIPPLLGTRTTLPRAEMLVGKVLGGKDPTALPPHTMRPTW